MAESSIERVCNQQDMDLTYDDFRKMVKCVKCNNDGDTEADAATGNVSDNERICLACEHYVCKICLPQIKTDQGFLCNLCNTVSELDIETEVKNFISYCGKLGEIIPFRSFIYNVETTTTSLSKEFKLNRTTFSDDLVFVTATPTSVTILDRGYKRIVDVDYEGPNGNIRRRTPLWENEPGVHFRHLIKLNDSFFALATTKAVYILDASYQVHYTLIKITHATRGLTGLWLHNYALYTAEVGTRNIYFWQLPPNGSSVVKQNCVKLKVDDCPRPFYYGDTICGNGKIVHVCHGWKGGIGANVEHELGGFLRVFNIKGEKLLPLEREVGRRRKKEGINDDGDKFFKHSTFFNPIIVAMTNEHVMILDKRPSPQPFHASAYRHLDESWTPPFRFPFSGGSHDNPKDVYIEPSGERVHVLFRGHVYQFSIAPLGNQLTGLK